MPATSSQRATTKAIAQLRDVSFDYRGNSRPLLQHVSAQIHPGEVVLLTGANGTGKSTILGLLSGRLMPHAGIVEVLGQQPARAHRTPAIGLVADPFHPGQGCLPVGLSPHQILNWLEIIDDIKPAAARRWKEQLGLSDAIMHRPVDHLSKGERQRVMLLVVLLRSPRLILADEPLDGVDSGSRALIGRCMAD